MPPKRSSKRSSHQRISSSSTVSMEQPNEPHGYRSSLQWPPQHNAILMKARREGLGWKAISKRYFPDKSFNACRKHHERLVRLQQYESWDEARLQALAKGYMELRKEMWPLLASRVGEKWQVVEQKCMEKGFKNLAALARSNSRRGAGSFSGTAENVSDDSGICMDECAENSEMIEEQYADPEQAESSRTGAERQLHLEQDMEQSHPKEQRILPTPPTTAPRATRQTIMTSYGPSIQSMLANSPTGYHPRR